MTFPGNLIWFILGEFVSTIVWVTNGFLFCLTIVGIPLGIQCFKIAILTLAPFGKTISFGEGSTLGNLIWLILSGIQLSMYHFITGILFYITIIGIPFGKQHFKLAKLSLTPFGATIS